MWMQECDVHGPVVAPNAGIELTTEQVEKTFPFVLSVTGVSDTLTQTNIENTNKITLAVGSFSIIALSSVLEAIFIKEDRVAQQSTPQPQQTKQQHKKGR